MPEIDSNWLVLIGTLFGGVGLKVIDKWLAKKQTKDDAATQIRSELRTEVVSLREQLVKAKEIEHGLEDEIEEWRSKFYDLRDERSNTLTQLTLAQDRIKALEALVESLRKNVNELEATITRLESIQRAGN